MKNTPKIPEMTKNDRMAMLESLKKTQDDSNFLKKSAKILINVYDLVKLFWKLKPEESLVINADGRILRGRVKNEKLTLLPEILAEKKPSVFDGNGIQEYFETRSWVKSPGNMFKNSWGNVSMKEPKYRHDLTVDIFLSLLEFSGDSTKIVRGEVNIENDFNYYTIKIEEMVGFYNQKSGILRYVELNGEKHYA
jgi:hypothetical protein